MVDFWWLIFSALYVIAGIGAVRVIDLFSPGKPKFLTFLIYPIALMIIAFQD